MKHFSKFLLGVSLLAISGTLVSQQSIRGIVTNAETRQPITGVTILLESTPIGTSSDEKGEYELQNILTGDYTLSASFIGYEVQKKRVHVESNVALALYFALQPTVLQGQTVVIAAERAKERETPVTFSNLSNKELQDSYYAQDIPMILSQLPSVTWYSENGNGIGYSYVKMRGFDQARIGVTLNGVPLNDAQSHFVYWIDMPDLASSVHDIQVQRGAGNAGYGAASIGGTINLTTSDFQTKKGFIAAVGSGSYGTQKYSLAVSSGLVDNTYSMYGRFSKVNTDGYRKNAWTDMWSYYLTFSRFDESLITRVNIFGGPERTHLSYEGITKAELQTDRHANKFTYNDETDNFNQPQYQLINEWQINPNLLATSTMYYIKGDGYYEQFKSARKFSDYGLSAFNISDSTTYPKSFYDRDGNGYVTIGADGKYTVKRTDLVRQKALDLSDVGWIPSMEWKHPDGTLSVGGEIRRNTGRHFGTIVWAAALPQGAQPSSLYYDYLGYRNLSSAYVREQYFVLPDVNVQAALQLQHTSYGIKNDDFTKHNYSLSYAFLTPRLGINYNVTSEVNLFGNWSIVKREPTLNDIHNEGDPLFKTVIPGVQYSDPLLKPETLHDYELGVGYATSRIRLKANGYLMDFRDELVFGGQINSVGEPILGNAEQTIHRGVELSAVVNPIDKLTLSGNLTLSKNYFVKYTENTYDVDAAGNYVAYLRDNNSIANFPDVIANARALYEYEGASAALTMQHVGKQFIDNSENEKSNVAVRASSDYIAKVVNAYTVFNLNFSYELHSLAGVRGVRASLFANNIFNNKYEYAGHIGYDDGAPRWFPAAERNYFAQLEFNF